MALKHYDPKRVTVSFSLVPLSGFAEGSVVSVETDGKAFEKVVGVDGDVTRSRREGVTDTITVRLMQTSRSNAVLSSIHALDQVADGGAGVAPLSITDGNGGSLHVYAEAWIENMPKAEYAEKAGPREWIFCAVRNPAACIEAGT